MFNKQSTPEVTVVLEVTGCLAAINMFLVVFVVYNNVLPTISVTHVIFYDER